MDYVEIHKHLTCPNLMKQTLTDLNKIAAKYLWKKNVLVFKKKYTLV